MRVVLSTLYSSELKTISRPGSEYFSMGSLILLVFTLVDILTLSFMLVLTFQCHGLFYPFNLGWTLLNYFWIINVFLLIIVIISSVHLLNVIIIIVLHFLSLHCKTIIDYFVTESLFNLLKGVLSFPHSSLNIILRCVFLSLTLLQQFWELITS